MSIIINGMNMPKGNSTKNLLIYSDGKVFTGHKDDANYSAEERKTGEWINITNDESLEEEYECSVCGYELFYSNPTKFCPNCGAYMRGSHCDDCRFYDEECVYCSVKQERREE